MLEQILEQILLQIAIGVKWVIIVGSFTGGIITVVWYLLRTIPKEEKK